MTSESLVPGSFIIRWKPGARRRPVDRVGRHFVVSSRHIGERSTVFRLNEATRRASVEALEELRRMPDRDDIAEVVPVYYRYPFRTPNDLWFKVQWNLTRTKVDRAWDTTTGHHGVKVAVVDTGILRDHPDFDKTRIAGGYDFVSERTSAADGDGWDQDPTDPGVASPDSSGLHGTHVAGVIGASSNNAIGVTGVDWACRIIPVRALGAAGGGRGDDADISAAIRWAAGLSVPGVPENPYPAHVINLSFGAEGDNAELRAAVQEAQQNGSIIVAAAGNFAIDARRTFPAAYPGVITVAATDYDGQLAKSYSNFGPVVKIMAPGGQRGLVLPGTSPTECNNRQCSAGIWSLSRMGSEYGYADLEGTSQAAPLVSGIVALMLQQKPGMDAREVTYILRETADHAAMCAQGCGSGLVDAEAALAWVAGRPLPNDSRAPFNVPPETINGSCAIAGPSQNASLLVPLLLLMALLWLAARW